MSGQSVSDDDSIRSNYKNVGCHLYKIKGYM